MARFRRSLRFHRIVHACCPTTQSRTAFRPISWVRAHRGQCQYKTCRVADANVYRCADESEALMDARTVRPLEHKEPPIGFTSEVELAGVAVIACMLLIAVCFAAPLLLKLPQVMDGAVRPRPTIREVSEGAAVQSVVAGSQRRTSQQGAPTGATDRLPSPNVTSTTELRAEPDR